MELLKEECHLSTEHEVHSWSFEQNQRITRVHSAFKSIQHLMFLGYQNKL